jgi:ParB family transcriptional regulator, chromosome partitioning protein
MITAAVLEPTKVIHIPLSKLVRSDKNVRRTDRNAGVAELADSFAAHGLLQNFVVRPVCDGKGKPTGTYAVSGGGRRLAALKLLVKRKQIKTTYPVPCIVKDKGSEEEISLAENVMRVALHPADQFDSFKRLADQEGFTADQIAARFGVTAHTVRQRLRLAAVSPKLMQHYRNGDLTLEQLMAFAITDDHARQEHVLDALKWERHPNIIRRMLMEQHVSSTDRRAAFVGVEAYEAAGGVIVRDLFSDKNDGYLADAALLDRLVSAKLTEAAAEVQAEGWKWVEAAPDFPHDHGMRRLYPEAVPLPKKAERQIAKLSAEHDELIAPYTDEGEIPEEVAEKINALSAEIDRLSERQYIFAAEDIARGGAFICLTHDGRLRVERGFIRSEDEPEAEDESAEGQDATPEPKRESGISDALMRDLTAHRTQALRLVVGSQPDVALIAVTHALVAQTFYRERDASCLDLRAISGSLRGHAAGIDETLDGVAVASRHEGWARQMPESPSGLWSFVAGLDTEQRMALFAHCAASTLSAVRIPFPKPHAMATAEKIGSACGLDMAKHWTPSVASYLSRVSKPQIAAAVTEAVSAQAATNIAGLKKQAMAEAAEKLLAGTGWLPAPLRKPVEGEDA